jgi:hypothetical protein
MFMISMFLSSFGLPGELGPPGMFPTFMSATLCNDRDLFAFRNVCQCFDEVVLHIVHRLRLPEATVSSHQLEGRGSAASLADSEHEVTRRLRNFQKCAVRDQAHRIRNEGGVLRGYSGFNDCLLTYAVV